MAERAKAVQESYEDRQTEHGRGTRRAPEGDRDGMRQRKKEQAAKGLDGLTYFVLCKLTDDGIPNPDTVSEENRRSIRSIPELAAKRGRAARAAKASDVRDLCGGR